MAVLPSPTDVAETTEAINKQVAVIEEYTEKGYGNAETLCRRILPYL